MVHTNVCPEFSFRPVDRLPVLFGVEYPPPPPGDALTGLFPLLDAISQNVISLQNADYVLTV